jgi:voltage-gated potassium channel
MEQAGAQAVATGTWDECLTEGHAPDANYCFHCGARLPEYHQQEKTAESA